MRADEDNDDVIESFSLYYIFSVFPSFVYYYIYICYVYIGMYPIANESNIKMLLSFLERAIQ